MKRKDELDSLEREIEAGIHTYVPMTGVKRRNVEAILDATRKTKNINIRISQMDLDGLKRNAAEEGLPYQTMISSILHKYLAGRLVDERHVLKSVEILSRERKSKIS